ncbi:beta-xylosidase [Verticillium alfalfae VaMs.102]|uniref:Beta-xylosidase n=1 Tax=Verticillium alfalfae (strain VaMs.102 / ATCC MYA-4576 / FGSC 10136) TaxID=526221 RepID=C9S870_VERA1|nr:beta-xylosidase [Verticillium alfalfae VaMs.102]EEY15320.1 beta-xylosidase [Verticillium alfalfae VaMs.102]
MHMFTVECDSTYESESATDVGLQLPVNQAAARWNPDPAILRVDDTYYIAVSSFTYFPGVPIYRSRDLANWELVSHALQEPQQLQLNGISSGNGKPHVLEENFHAEDSFSTGVWAPGFSHIDGRFYITSMTRWGDDPDNRTWPRIWWTSSEDLETWTDLVWAEPYGIDPELFRDPDSGKTYLLLMGPNNNHDRVWGITQCEVDLRSGKCIGPYFNTWNGTLPHDAKSRPEGPKMFKREGWYYLLLAEGGTSTGHRATIGRSKSPEGPWEAAPNNPLIYNGADQTLTIQSTGHATFTETPGGAWFASLLARRNVKGASPLGREAFLVNVTWADGWPTMNGGRYLLPSQFTEGNVVRKPWIENFEGAKLDLSWYQVRTPYTENYRLLGAAGNSTAGKMTGGLVFHPNVFTLSDRDVPAALFHKQTSLNMTFSATLLPTTGVLGPRQQQFETRQMANGQGYSVFEGAMFALFASGAGEPWPFDAPDVGFGSVGEVFRQENIPDFDDWSG